MNNNTNTTTVDWWYYLMDVDWWYYLDRCLLMILPLLILTDDTAFGEAGNNEEDMPIAFDEGSATIPVEW